MKNILFFLKTPPPNTGATMMNNRVMNSTLLNSEFDIRKIGVTYSEKIEDLGKLTFLKAFKTVYYLLIIVWELIFHRPEFVYFHMSPKGVSFFRDSVYVLFIKLFRIKILFHQRARGVKEVIKGSNFKKKYYRFIYENTYVICLTEVMIDDIDEVYFDTPYVVYNGTPKIENIEVNKPPVEIKNILFLSNLIVSKGIYDFVDALALLKQRGYAFTGTIVGAEADVTKEKLQERITSGGVEDVVKYEGPKYEEEKFRKFEDADIFVFPTYFHVETFGSVIIEAMQFSLPVISTNYSSIPVIIDEGETGFLVDIKSPEQIADKLGFLLNNENERIRMGKQARKVYLDKFTFEVFEKNLCNVFKSVIEK